MVKLRTGDAWMPAPEYSRTLHGLSVNLLVRDIERALVFQREVLAAEVVYSDPDFAVLRRKLIRTQDSGLSDDILGGTDGPNQRGPLSPQS